MHAAVLLGDFQRLGAQDLGLADRLFAGDIGGLNLALHMDAGLGGGALGLGLGAGDFGQLR